MTTPSGGGYQIGVDPATGMLTLNGETLSRTDPRLWGSRGYQEGRREVADPNAGDSGAGMMEADPTEGWEGLQATGRHQLGSAGVSSGQEGQGFGEFNINNLADLQYDPEYGITTSNPDFIDSSDDPDDRARFNRIRLAMTIAMAGGAAAGAGVFGGAAGAGAAPTAGAVGDLSTVGFGAGFGTGGGTAGGAAMGSLGSGGSLVGTGLGSGWGALGTGANLAGTGLVSGAGAGLAGTGVSGAALAGGAGALAGLAPVSGAIGAGTGIPAIDSMRDAATRIGSGNMDWTDLARQLVRSPNSSGGDSGGSAGGGLIGDIINTYLGSQNPSAMDEFNRNRGWQEDMMNQTTRANRPNQNTAFGSSRWEQDPSGQWTQNVTLNPRDQQRLDTNRGIQQTALERARDYKPLDTSQFRHRSFGGSYLGF
jgi:hypothetical protein